MQAHMIRRHNGSIYRLCKASYHQLGLQFDSEVMMQTP